MNKTLISFTILLFLSMSTFGQVGINTNSPNLNSSLHIDSKNGTKGVLLPKINNAQETTLTSILGINDSGLAYYNTESKCLNTWNGTIFNKLCEQGNAVFTIDCSTSSINGSYRQNIPTTNAEFIKLTVDVTQEGPFDISGTSNNGYYFTISGYLPKGEQDIILRAVGTPTNIGQNTITLKNNLTSEALCSYTVNVLPGTGLVTIDCTKLTQTVVLVKDNPNQVAVTIPVNVTLEGPVTISTTSQNGVAFSGSANLTTIGNNNSIVMYSEGAPDDIGDFLYEILGTENQSICTLKVQVVPNTVSPSNPLPSVTAYGTYIQDQDLSTNQKVTATGISFTDIGVYGLGIRYVSGGNGDPGLQFESKTGTSSLSPPTLTLDFPAVTGTIPTDYGTFTYTLYDIYSDLNLVPFNITVQAKIGTFANPADKCTQILTQISSSKDGYYWIKDGSNKYKTYCDMSNGGWTLIKSFSEKTIFVTVQSQENRLSRLTAKNTVSTENGVFNEYYFSFSSATANTISGGTALPKDIRISIKEKGHTTASGATASQVESSTIAPTNDSWFKDNFWILSISNTNLFTSSFNGNTYYNYYTASGKFFGLDFQKTASSRMYSYNGINFRANPNGFYSDFFTGFYGATNAYTNNSAATTSYTSSNNSIVTFNSYVINDMFGIYHRTEPQVNHHIGTCSNSQDDYGGASSCSAGWANWRPHKFNNGEGRILQYWVK